MTWSIIIVLVIVFVLFVSYYNPEARQNDAKLRHILNDRPKRSDEDYYKAFFPDSSATPEIVAEIRRIFDKELGLDLRGLEPDDDLSTDYSVIWEMDSLADVEIVVAIEKAYGIEIDNGEAASVRNVRMIAERVAAKLGQLEVSNTNKLKMAAPRKPSD